MKWTLIGLSLVIIAMALTAAISANPAAGKVRADSPQARDSRLEVSLFAAAPDIVHPIGIDFDAKGRLLVIESHTHFPPKDYAGPKHDRVRMLEDTDNDGRADRFTTFCEGMRATMDIAVHPDSSVYLATRNEVLRLRDNDGDGKADEQTRLVFLDTKGSYPHNGLSGLAFDSKGNVLFGMGENEGAGYRISGTDGQALVGEGEGGNIFWCTAEGRNLRRVATGFWNPFGLCVDGFQRVFAVDNDADAMPPCRLLHVVDGGDYGYQYRYGRSGRHPFQAWNGQLAGTLPMVSGTGEGPCEVLGYESDGLPPEYRGNLLVASWADHRIERYELTEHGASVRGERKPLVQGGKDFHPVGLAVAPDGSLFASDWVLSDYQLHQRGAIWHIRWKRPPASPARPADVKEALFSVHRPVRESAARVLARDENGSAFLRKNLAHADPGIRGTLINVLADKSDAATDWTALAENETAPPLRALAVRALVARGEDAHRFADAAQPAAVRREAVSSLKDAAGLPVLLQLLAESDPFLVSAAIHQLARQKELLAKIDWRRQSDPRQRMGGLLALRASDAPNAAALAASFLADPNEDVRFLAAKWIADHKLAACRPLLVEALKAPGLNVPAYLAYSTALARVNNQDADESKMAGYFFQTLVDDGASPGLRAKALQIVPSSEPRLTLEVLGRVLAHPDKSLRLEALRTISEHPHADRHAILRKIALEAGEDEQMRAQAVLGLADQAAVFLEDLLALAQKSPEAVQSEALRALAQMSVNAKQRAELEALAADKPQLAPLVNRALGMPFAEARPAAADAAAWLTRSEGPADPDAGRRIFFQTKLASCSRCHRAEGRGHDIGPDLSWAGRNERRKLLEAILQPSNLVAPHYQNWAIETRDGQVRTGMLLRTHLDEYTYVDAKGDSFKVATGDITESRPLSTSVMPDGLLDQLTDQEIRDLLAYLSALR